MAAGLLFLSLLALTGLAGADPLTVMFWNLESPGHDNHVGDKPTADIDFLLKRFPKDFRGADLVGFAEVEPEWQEPLQKGLGENWQVRLSEGGGHDRLALAWRTDRFQLESWEELHQLEGPFQVGGKSHHFRPGLAAHLLDEQGRPLVFCVNHLARSRRETGPGCRRQQARLLRSWLTTVSAPTVMVGDFNFDYHLREGDRDNSGFTVLTEGDLFHWVRYPDPLVATIEGFESVLDFVFTANGAQAWPARSEVLVTPEDFHPEDQNSDHRPVRARLEMP